MLDEKYSFEIGGKDKNFKQLKDVKQGCVVSDDIEIGIENKIPLWLFGFMYECFRREQYYRANLFLQGAYPSFKLQKV